MTEAVIVALITAFASILGNYLISRKARTEDEVKRAKSEQRIEDRMQTVEKKLDEHNGYAKLFSTINESITRIQKDIEYLRGK